MSNCSHTSDWWKNHQWCLCCGAKYSDEEADNIAKIQTRVFTKEQKELIELIELIEHLKGGEDEPK